MAITLKNLLIIAPFDEDKRKILLEKLDQLTEDQKYRLSKAAWESLAQLFYGRLQVEHQKIMDEVLAGKKLINQNDFHEAEARLLHEFAQNLESVESEQSIAEVKKQLEAFKVKPLVQDASDSPIQS